MARVPVDFFLFVGDTIYGDHVCDGPEFVPGSGFVAKTLPQYHAKHRYNRADASVQDYFRTTGVFAIWDDHEVVNDFSGSVEPRMPTGRQAFSDTFRSSCRARSPAALRALPLGRLRSIHPRHAPVPSANSDPDGPGKTMLTPQRRWLVRGIRPAGPWVVVTSVSLSVPTGREGRDPKNASLGFSRGGRHRLRHGARRHPGRPARPRSWNPCLAADAHHAELIQHRPIPNGLSTSSTRTAAAPLPWPVARRCAVPVCSLRRGRTASSA